MKHIELINDYLIDGEDYIYNDNHGRLIRCRDCCFADGKRRMCTAPERTTVAINEDDYCSRARLREGG